MKPLWTTSCLLAHSFWRNAVADSLELAAKYGEAKDSFGFLRNVDDALDACMRSADWLINWKQATFA